MQQQEHPSQSLVGTKRPLNESAQAPQSQQQQQQQQPSSASHKMPRTVSMEGCSSNSNTNNTPSAALLANAIQRRDGREALPPSQHPHKVLLQMMKDYGCDVTESRPYTDMPASFFHQPLPEEMDAYAGDLLLAVRQDNVTQLRTFLQQGRNLNCCNRFGEYLLHLAARKKLVATARFLIHEARVSLRVHDDFGRTVLHDACWTDPPCLEVVDLIIDQCPDLLLVQDKRGHTPLFYARKEYWPLWMNHLRQKGRAIVPRTLVSRSKEEEETSPSDAKHGEQTKP